MYAFIEPICLDLTLQASYFFIYVNVLELCYFLFIFNPNVCNLFGKCDLVILLLEMLI